MSKPTFVPKSGQPDYTLDWGRKPLVGTKNQKLTTLNLLPGFQEVFNRFIGVG